MTAYNYSRRTQEHIDEARSNYRRYERMIQEPEDVSWSAVMLFYSALHLIQAYARHYTPGDIPGDHEDRADYASVNFPPDIAQNYIKLDRVSRQARYHLTKFTAPEVKSLHDSAYAKIRRYLREQGISW